MRLLFAALLLSLLRLGLPAAALACTPSAHGSSSFEVRVSPRAGYVCAHVITVYEGGSCSGTVAGAVDVGCGLTSRLAIRDDGVLVSILAPRASRRRWSILRVFRVGDPERAGYLSLDDLPATAELRGRVQVTFDGAAVVFDDRRRRVRVALDELPDREDRR
jgi:hypothetical protein